MQFSGKVGNGPKNKLLNFGGDPDLYRDTGEGMHCPSASSYRWIFRSVFGTRRFWDNRLDFRGDLNLGISKIVFKTVRVTNSKAKQIKNMLLYYYLLRTNITFIIVSGRVWIQHCAPVLAAQNQVSSQKVETVTGLQSDVKSYPKKIGTELKFAMKNDNRHVRYFSNLTINLMQKRQQIAASDHVTN